MYQMDTVIPFVSAGADNRLKLHEAVTIMMNCCQFQEYQEQEFCRFLRENNLAVFLFSIQIDIFRMPLFREKVTAAVKIYGCKSIYGLRRITIRDEAGNLCLIANATGAFYDLAGGKAIKLDTDNIALKFDEAEKMECLPRKIPMPQMQGIIRPAFTVTPSYQDPNGHLTSSAYFSIASDALPENFIYNRVRLEFKQQAKAGKIILPVTYPVNEKCAIVDLRAGDGTSYAAAEFTAAELILPENFPQD
ncbi:MAG: hypothetical protein E7043_04930 [Lentisphaerae bacterium]|nr:hypothetical protein [Lentisphaerota bacterium]